MNNETVDAKLRQGLGLYCAGMWRMITQRLGWENIQEALSGYRGQIHKDRGEPIHVAIVVSKRFEPTFKTTFGDFRATRARLDSVVNARNRLAHGEKIDEVDAEFALMAMESLLRAAEQPEVDSVQAIRRAGSVRQGERLEWLALKYEGSPLEKKSVGNRDRGFRDRDVFLRKYPFLEQSEEIGQRIRTREDIYDFLALIRALWPLGSIGQLNLDEAADAAAAQIEHFRDLLVLTFGSQRVAEKIDAWDIPQFGGSGERMIVKKIIAIYYPDETIPIFRTDKLVYHCKRLGLNISAASIDTLSIGQKWERLTSVLLDAKKQHPMLRAKDNVYFMYLLEDTVDMSQMT